MRLIKNKALRKIGRNGLLLSVGLLSAFGLLQTTENKAYADQAEGASVITYKEGEIFTPAENIEITVDDTTSVPATKAIIKFPDGKVYELDKFILEQCGLYEITYYGENGTEKVSASDCFVVTDAAGNVDTNAPVVTVSGTSYNVVLNEEISINTNVEISDDTYHGDLKVAVYQNYGTKHQTLVYYENGVFIPKAEGTYSVVYTATDGYGNVGRKVIEYIVDASATDAIAYTEPEALETLVACQEYELPQIEAIGLNGNVSCEIVITNPLGEEESFKNEAAAFIPTVLGEYTIAYTLTDAIYQKTFFYTVDCENTDEAVLFPDTIALPHYFIKEATYTIYDYMAYKPTSEGLKEYATEVYVKVDGAEEYNKVENLSEYKVTANESLQFKYVCGEKYVESEVIPVQTNVAYGTDEVNYLNYFVGNHTAAEATIDSFSFTFSGSEETGTLDFVNPIAFTSFNLNFLIQNEYDNFNAIEFILTDYENSENVNKIIFTKTENGFIMQVNAITSAEIAGTEFTGNTFSFWVNQTEGVFRTSLTTDAGASLKFAYNQFESYLCHLQIRVQGISDESKIAISKINNQTLQADLYLQKPEMSITMLKGFTELGGKAIIYPMNFSNVLFPTLETNGTVTVTDPSGQIVTATDGTLLKGAVANCEYEIELLLAGSYIVKYTAKVVVDGVEYATASSSGAINSMDNVAPVVTFDNGANSSTVVELKVGQLHQVYTYKATDNATDSKEIQTTMLVYNEKGWLVDALESYTAFNTAGTYRIVILAIDKDGNIGSNGYTIVVR